MQQQNMAAVVGARLAYQSVGVRSGWLRVSPLRRAGSGLANEIQGMLPAGHIYGGDTIVSTAHESTHGVNSRLRQYAGHGANAFFIGRDYRAFVLREPRVPLALVGRFVPTACRGVSFHLYLVQQAAQWSDAPLYVLDEWTAYVNGAEAGIETGHPETYELQQAVEFCGYATALLLAVERHDTAYPDKAKLQEFIGWQCQRVSTLAVRARALGSRAWSLGCERAMKNFERRFVK